MKAMSNVDCRLSNEKREVRRLSFVIRHSSFVIALVLAGCTTTEGPSQKADLKEAARLNAQLGIDYMRKGNFELALEKLQKSLDQDDELGVAHSAIALVYQRKGETKLAGKHYREALDINADDSVTLNNFGIFLCGQGEFEDAEEVFLKAAKNKDNLQTADAWANAGTCAPRDDEGRVRAEGYLREALRLNPRHANALASLARVSYEKKDYLRARAFLQRYEMNSRPTAETLYVGAQTERALGDMTAARAYERRLRNDFPDSRETEMLEKASRPGKR